MGWDGAAGGSDAERRRDRTHTPETTRALTLGRMPTHASPTAPRPSLFKREDRGPRRRRRGARRGQGGVEAPQTAAVKPLPSHRGGRERGPPVRTGFGMDTGNDPSAGSPTETLLRLLLPLNNKVWTASRSVASGEPNASPQSGGLTGSFNR